MAEHNFHRRRTGRARKRSSLINGGGGLDSAHSQLYRSLLEKEQWSRKEATELCGNLNLMLGGALEVINDWSYAVVDAPVLDDADDDIWVDLEIAKELEG
ncbi:hypothetical protein IE980_29635 [Klebsiella pneumoniae]|uniref:TerB-C domain-containing protein n=1 Tax=Klebsiella pneumoniae TaxID=573 RepID=A0A927E5H7_KLEPN|nr:hypothetical protein [Klebsiella pneumoniae]